MAVDSTSTISEIVDAIADNASYQENDSLTEAEAFVSAARLYIFKVPSDRKTVPLKQSWMLKSFARK